MLGDPENTKVRHEFQIPKWLGNAASRLKKYTKKNSEKYKGKIRKQDISVFGPKHNLVGYLKWLAAFLSNASFDTYIEIHTYMVFVIAPYM